MTPGSRQVAADCTEDSVQMKGAPEASKELLPMEEGGAQTATNSSGGSHPRMCLAGA